MNDIDRRLELYEENVEWFDLAGWCDTQAELAEILTMLHTGKADEAHDRKDKLLRQYAVWRLESEAK